MKNLIVKSGLLITSISTSSVAWAQQTGRYYDHNMMWGGSVYGWLFGVFMMLLFIALGTAVVMLVVKALGGHKKQSVSTQYDENTDAISILKKRFAMGEIDKDEFERTKILFCLLYTSPSPRDRPRSRMPSSA